MNKNNNSSFLRNVRTTILLTLGVVTFAHCGQKTGTGSKDSTEKNTVDDDEKAKPTKSKMIADLKTFIKLIKSEDYDKASKYIKWEEEGSTSKEVEKNAEIILGEVTSDGIELLKEDGKFGTLEDLFPSEFEYMIKRAGIDEEKLDKCYAMKYRRAELTGLWSGKNFKFFRFANINKREIESSDDEEESSSKSNGRKRQDTSGG